MKHYWNHFKSVMRHKWFVGKECVKLSIKYGQPLLLWQAVIHDWSKFRPSEFIAYKNNFQNHNVLYDEFDQAWNLHQKSHPHHWQWWYLIEDSGKEKALMPTKLRYVLEMLADWRGANKAYSSSKTLLQWYTERRNTPRLRLHPLLQAFMDFEIGFDSGNNLRDKVAEYQEKIADAQSWKNVSWLSFEEWLDQR